MTRSAAKCGPLRRPGSTWQPKDFPSCMLVFCSQTREVRSLALPPTTCPANPQWNGRPTWWTTRPLTMSGRILLVTMARTSMRPRAVLTVTQPPWTIPRSAASSGLSSTNISGCNSLSQELNRLIGPLR